MRQRRTNFSVKLSRHGSNAVKSACCLAYSKERAIAYLEWQGYTVLECLSPADQKALGGFTIDKAALAEAIDFLGLTLPVKIRHNGRVGATRGNYRYDPGKGHSIMIKSYLRPEQASRTLWHELTHAMQAERALASGQGWPAFVATQRRYSYDRRPIEVEARANEEYAEAVPLCR